MEHGFSRRIRRFAGEAARRAAHVALALALGLEPLAANAASSTTTTTNTTNTTNTSINTATWTAPIGQTNQQGLQQNAGNANNTGSTMSSIVSILSMAAGGVAIAMGASELSCCTQGCFNASGVKSVGEKAATDAGAAAAAPAVQKSSGTTQRQPVDYWKLRFPDGAQNNCPRRFRMPFPLFQLFQPTRAKANGCADALLALATGGVMLISGMLGMQAANKQGQNSTIAMGNSTGMDTLGGFDGSTSPTGSSANNSGTTGSHLGAGNGNGGGIKLDPALLRTGTANDIMGQFEHKFGIARDSFAQNVISGEDPRKLLATAPANPLSVSDMNKAINLAQNMTPEQKAAAQSATLNQAQAEMMAKLGPDGGGGGTAARAPAGRYDFNPDENLVSIGSSTATDTSNTPLSDISVSPEVQAALLARQLDESKVDAEKLTLFERVHLKYRDKTKMIFGYDPSGPLKGVGNENGM